MFLRISILFISIFCLVFSNVVSQSFKYDEQGRLIADWREGIASIKWNNQNKITDIIRSDTSHQPDLTFSYNAAGDKVFKVVKPRNGKSLSPQSEWKQYYYVSQPNHITVYSKRYEKVGSKKYTEYLGNEHHQSLAPFVDLATRDQHEEIAHSFSASIDPNGNFVSIVPDGVLIPTVSDGEKESQRGANVYELKNFRYDITTGVADRKQSSDSRAVVVRATDYYPFGMVKPGRSIKNSQRFAYSAGFTGKETMDELGDVYDYGARLYQTNLGRWLSQDPKTSIFPSQSPYNYAFNSPISLVDPDGEEPVSVMYEKKLVSLITSIRKKVDDLHAMSTFPTPSMIEDKNGDSKMRSFVEYLGWITERKFTIPNAMDGGVISYTKTFVVGVQTDYNYDAVNPDKSMIDTDIEALTGMVHTHPGLNAHSNNDIHFISELDFENGFTSIVVNTTTQEGTAGMFAIVVTDKEAAKHFFKTHSASEIGDAYMIGANASSDVTGRARSIEGVRAVLSLEMNSGMRFYEINSQGIATQILDFNQQSSHDASEAAHFAGKRPFTLHTKPNKPTKNSGSSRDAAYRNRIPTTFK